MSEYVAFESRVEPMEWGKSTYTVMRIPPDALAAIGPTRRVEGEINDHPVNLALTKAPAIEDVFVWAGKSFLKEVGLAPGELAEIRLRAAPDDVVEVPADVTNALRSSGLIDRWDKLTPGKKRGLLHQVGTAKRAETRTRRIAALLATLQES